MQQVWDRQVYLQHEGLRLESNLETGRAWSVVCNPHSLGRQEVGGG